VRHTFLTPATLGRLRLVSERIVAWTVNDVGRAQQLIRLGIDGITSDNPLVFSCAASNQQVSG
jgi:glycerophosphoryl diester phosphodiesterase